MYRLSHLKKSAKVFICIMMFVLFLFLAGVFYLEVTDNFALESMSHYFVGDTESEITVDEVISYNRQEIEDENLDEGITETRQAGKDGKKIITFRVTKDKDGKEINRAYIGEEVIAEAVDEIVAIGARVPETTNRNQSQESRLDTDTSQKVDNSINIQPSAPSTDHVSQQQAYNDPQSNNDGPHYCTSPYQLERGDEGWYVKVNIPCSEMSGKWSPYTVEVTETDYYSRKICRTQAGPSDLIIEVRCEK